MINPHNIQTGLAHEGEIDIHLLGPTEIVSGLKGPYVTPLTKNFLSPSKKNFAAGRIRESLVVVMSSGVEASLDQCFLG